MPVPSVRLGGVDVPLGQVALVTLVVATSSQVLAMRYSRNRPTSDGLRYLSSTAVVMAEALKVTVSTLLYAREVGAEGDSGLDVGAFVMRLKTELIGNYKDTLMLGVPGGLYLLQNNLLFIALSHLDAATYQITYQLKILTTAVFSYLMLGKTFNSNQKTALVMLFVGVALVQLPDNHTAGKPMQKGGNNVYTGLMAVLMACCTSAFAGVYFERILKKKAGSLWLRNIQLGLFGIVLGTIGAYSKDGAEIAELGFLHHYSADVWLVVALQGAAGLVVASVIKYADNVLKTFANAVSVLLSGVISFFFLSDLNPTTAKLVGAPIVLSATYLYGRPPAAANTPPKQTLPS
jgi:UDP-sugar transporter A1/2/3